jgi:hypothetical protein
VENTGALHGNDLRLFPVVLVVAVIVAPDPPEVVVIDGAKLWEDTGSSVETIGSWCDGERILEIAEDDPIEIITSGDFPEPPPGSQSAVFQLPKC